MVTKGTGCMMVASGKYTATLDLRPGGRAEIWRHGIKLEPRAALDVVNELRELLIDQLEAAP